MLRTAAPTNKSCCTFTHPPPLLYSTLLYSTLLACCRINQSINFNFNFNQFNPSTWQPFHQKERQESTSSQAHSVSFTMRCEPIPKFWWMSATITNYWPGSRPMIGIWTCELLLMMYRSFIVSFMYRYILLLISFAFANITMSCHLFLHIDSWKMSRKCGRKLARVARARHEAQLSTRIDTWAKCFCAVIPSF